nr:hypothetical protein [Tanacetum cinerariifolium]
EATDDSPAVPEHTTVETPTNMSPDNKAHFLAEKEAIHLILTGIGDDIYLTVDAFQMAQEMWEAIKRLQQGESLNIQDVKTNLFWEFGKFTSHDGESMESYYTRFYKLMNEMIKNNLTVTTMQECQSSSISCYCCQDQYYQTSRSHRSSAPSPKPLILSRSQTTTRHKGKERAKPITPPSETASEEDSDPEQAQRDKDMQKNLALIAKTVNVAGTREKVGSQYDWLADTDEEFDEQELEAHYSYMAKIQEVPTADSGTDSEPVEQNDQKDVESDDEHVALANLIANLKLDVDENKKIQKQLKKANTALSQELKECKTILAETSKSLRKSISVRDSCLVALQTKQTEFEKYKAFNDRTIDYDKLEHKLNEALGQLAHKDTVIKEGLKTKAYELSVVNEKHDELMKQSLLTKSHYEGLVKQKKKQEMHVDLKYVESLEKEIDELEYEK